MNVSQPIDKALAELQQIIPPDLRGKAEAIDEDAIRRSLSEKLATQLPDDYWAFSRLYGGGVIGVPGHSQVINVLCPFNKRYTRTLDTLIDIYTESPLNYGAENQPCAIHPDRPGLLPWGFGDNRRAFFWHTAGHPQEWRVVYLTPEQKVVHTNTTFVTFLMEMFHEQIDLGGSFNGAWFKDNVSKMSFRRIK